MRRSLWGLALGLLVIIDAALVAWALRPGDQTAPGADVTATSSTPSSATTTASSSTAAAAPDRVIVVPTGAASAWRVITGSACGGSVTVASSQDSGATWKAGPKVDLRMVSSVSTDDNGRPVLTGLNEACKPATLVLEDTGAKATETRPGWAINPADVSTLLHTGKATAKACATGTIKDLATDTAERANVLCDGGVVRRTTDSGATWSTVGTVKNATGISTAGSGQGYRVYVASRQNCGIRVAALAEEANGSADGCVEGTTGVKAADIAIWGRTIWAADQSKAWVVPMSNPVAAHSSTTTQSSTQESANSTDAAASNSAAEPSSTSNPYVAPSSTEQWTPSSTRQWTPSSTRQWTPSSTRQWTPSSNRQWTPSSSRQWTPSSTTEQESASTDPGLTTTAAPSVGVESAR
ncbi:hypothetical protein [Calidifontibacter indicus]|uniref:Uncharacterized protein n=1 Tax=Calidifontibacter indicus TaxID=419650 RepID=A0A3D9UM35_9MICO|nr:hypothetical protein [Calidifontibacter indicus]REF30357.1 hypothetical protein DFJ65_1363 [Calidifontibacter indicus]